MFGDPQSDEVSPGASGRYNVQMVSRSFGQKKHLQSVQEALNTGSLRGWRLVSANDSNFSGLHTILYWDTEPHRDG